MQIIIFTIWQWSSCCRLVSNGVSGKNEKETILIIQHFGNFIVNWGTCTNYLELGFNEYNTKVGAKWLKHHLMTIKNVNNNTRYLNLETYDITSPIFGDTRITHWLGKGDGRMWEVAGSNLPFLLSCHFSRLLLKL